MRNATPYSAIFTCITFAPSQPSRRSSQHSQQQIKNLIRYFLHLHTEKALTPQILISTSSRDYSQDADLNDQTIWHYLFSLTDLDTFTDVITLNLDVSVSPHGQDIE